jgi:hypothetical protein
MSTSVLYAIQARNGAIKVGHSLEPQKRLVAVRTHSPLPVRLIAIIGPGGLSEERALHKRFEHCRSHAEWFFGSDIDAFSLEIMGRGLPAIENWSDLEFIGAQGRSDRHRRRIRAAWDDPERRMAAARSQIEWRVWDSFHHLLGVKSYSEVKQMAEDECRRRRPDLYPQEAA